ncbi:MAG: hypothetical protein ACKOAD_02395, partial [Gammaproteobacteria bacterium]
YPQSNCTKNRHRMKNILEQTKKRPLVVQQLGSTTQLADAILDRLVNSSHRIDLKGESLSKGILKNE